MLELRSQGVLPAAVLGVGFGVAVTPPAWGKEVSSYPEVANLQATHCIYMELSTLRAQGP